MNTSDLEIFLVVPPGLEALLCAEAAEKGFRDPVATTGGVTVQGSWGDVWRANLVLRGAARVLVRIGSFRVMHLAQLDKRARKFDWASVLRADLPVKVDVTCKASKIYHAGAATQRIERAITEELGAPLAADAEIRIKVRIDDDLCTISLDSTGESLHIRGHKEAVGKAPMRENLASLFLRQCGFDGREPVMDPMCGSGTFIIEAAEIAAGVYPGRSRHFAFEKFANFDATAWDAMRVNPAVDAGPARFIGSDRDTGAVRMATGNAARAGVDQSTLFRHHAVSDLAPPEGPPGLVIVNPPYGARIGEKKLLFAVYGALGKTLRQRFRGWRVGMVTSDAGLARSSELPFLPVESPVSHGGTRITLYRTDPLP